MHDLLFQLPGDLGPLKEPGPFFVSLADSADVQAGPADLS